MLQVFCSKRDPNCSACPVQDQCEYARSNWAAQKAGSCLPWSRQGPATNDNACHQRFIAWVAEGSAGSACLQLCTQEHFWRLCQNCNPHLLANLPAGEPEAHQSTSEAAASQQREQLALLYPPAPCDEEPQPQPAADQACEQEDGVVAKGSKADRRSRRPRLQQG